MSKINNNILKLKIESIAKALIKKSEETKTNFLTTNKFPEESKQNNLNLSTNTLKDSLSCLEDFKNNFYKDVNIKKIQTNYYKKNSNINNIYKYNNYSSICSKGTLSSDDLNNINSINNLYKKDKIQSINIKLNNLKNNENEDEKKIRNILLNKINIEELKELKKIYEQMINIFNNVKNEDKIIKNNSDETDDYINKLKILSFHYIKALLSENIEYVTKLFYDSIEMNKFILYQIYLFLSIIYLKENKLNEYLLLSYKTILLYSSKNFDNIFDIIIDFTLFYDEKKNQNIISLNKIIISILKTLTDVPSNHQIMYYIMPVQNTIEISGDYNNLDIEQIINKRISGINNLLILLKENKDLSEKLHQLEVDEIKLAELYNNMENTYEIEEVINKNGEMIETENNIEKILPEIDEKKYKYIVILELDETLVHYCEEKDNYFVIVRYGCENFIEYINNFCEVIVVSTSGIEYSDIIINNLDKNKSLINNRIYNDNFKDLDLSKINRDMNKTFFICHEYNFLNAPKSNIIKLKEFDGDEKDKEFVKLHEEFKKIENEKIDDVKTIITEIQNNIEKEVIEDI